MAKPVDMYDIACALGLVLALGLLLMFLRKPLSEGFGNPMACDVDNPCSGYLKCINGFCAKTDPVGVREENPIPMLPPGSPFPYF
jgi:hypothetical protein